jgi:N-methylhydantoinase A/oxoprolinase/acetone carboxylase beta subunit
VSPARGTRNVYFGEAGDFVACRIYDRYGLTSGMRIAGPAIVEELDSTCVVHPGYAATVDEVGNLLLAPEDAEVTPAIAGDRRTHARAR